MTGQTVLWDDNASSTIAASVTFRNCIIGHTQTTYNAVYLYRTALETTRDLTLENVQFNVPNGGFIRNGAVRNLTLINCGTVRAGTASPAMPHIDLGTVADARLGTCQMIGGTWSTSHSDGYATLTTGLLTVGDVILEEVTFDAVNHPSVVIAAATGGNVRALVRRCTFTTTADTRTCTQLAAGECIPSSSKTLGNIICVGNTFNFKGTRPGDCSSIAIYSGVSRGFVAYNRVLGQSYWTGVSNSSIGIWLLGNGVTVMENVVYANDAIILSGAARGNVVVHNTLYDNHGDATRFPLIFRDDLTTPRDPSDNVLMFNVIQNSSAATMSAAYGFMRHDASEMAYASNVLDDNCVRSSQNLASFGGCGLPGLKADLAAVRLFWTGVGGVSSRNDQHTIEADPQLVNVLAGDLRIGHESPAKGCEEWLWHALGAWQTPSGVPSDLDNDSVPDFLDNCPAVANQSQADGDSDGVGDSCDSCPGTPLGVKVDFVGCPAPVPGDLDRDGDVDQTDFGIFQRCWSGPNIPANPECAK